MPDVNTQPAVNHLRGGLNLEMGDLTDDGVTVSPSWMLGGWQIQFLRLAPNETTQIDQSNGQVYLKIVAGHVDGRDVGAYPAIGTVASTRWSQSSVRAAQDGALICLFTQTGDVPDTVRSMDELLVQGPFNDSLVWQSFEDKFAAFTHQFDGLAAFMLPGFHLLDATGRTYAYVHFWTAGNGVDLSTHNHGQDPTPTSPAFAEVHMVLNNGTGEGGMYGCDRRDSLERTRSVLVRGEEHGPYFHVDDETGRPVMKPNGAVSYPWHGWQAGQGSASSQTFDLVVAVEITTDYARV